MIIYTVTPAWQKTLIEKTLQVCPQKAGSKMFWFTNKEILNPEKPETILDKIFSIAQVNELNQLHSILE